MYYENLPIYRSAVQLIVCIETVVHGFLLAMLRYMSNIANTPSACKTCALIRGKKCLWGANSYNLLQTVGVLNETDPCAFNRM